MYRAILLYEYLLIDMSGHDHHISLRWVQEIESLITKTWINNISQEPHYCPYISASEDAIPVYRKDRCSTRAGICWEYVPNIL